MDKALLITPNDADALYYRGFVLGELNRCEDAAASYERALKARPSDAKTKFALCMASLPTLYMDGAEIAQRRDLYAARLQSLSAEVARGRARDFAGGVGPKQPFYLAYQGENDRDLQSIYGAMVCKIMADRYPVAAVAEMPLPGEADQGRHRQRILSQPFELENPDQGLAQRARPATLSPVRLLHRRGRRRADRRGRAALRALRPRSPAGRALARRDPGRRAACPDLSRGRHGQHRGSTRGPASRAGAVQFLGASGHQRISDPGLFPEQRPHGAGGRPGSLHRATGSPAQSLVLLRTAGDTARGDRTLHARHALDCDRLLVRTILVQISAPVRRGLCAHRARACRLPVRLHRASCGPRRHRCCSGNGWNGPSAPWASRRRIIAYAAAARPAQVRRRDRAAATSFSTASAGRVAIRPSKACTTICRS